MVVVVDLFITAVLYSKGFRTFGTFYPLLPKIFDNLLIIDAFLKKKKLIFLLLSSFDCRVEAMGKSVAIYSIKK